MFLHLNGTAYKWPQILKCDVIERLMVSLSYKEDGRLISEEGEIKEKKWKDEKANRDSAERLADSEESGQSTGCSSASHGRMTTVNKND